MPTCVLLIDDDVRLVAMLGDYLRSRGYQVDVCGDGEAGLAAEAAPDHTFIGWLGDGLFSDTPMPGRRW